MKKKSPKYEARMAARRLANGTDAPATKQKTTWDRCIDRMSQLKADGIDPHTVTDVGRTMRRSQFIQLIEACEDYKRNVHRPNSKESIPYRDAVSILCTKIFTGQELCGILTEDMQLVKEWNECFEFKVSGISWGRSARILIGKFEICWSRIDTQFHSGEWPYGWPWEIKT